MRGAPSHDGCVGTTRGVRISLWAISARRSIGRNNWQTWLDFGGALQLVRWMDPDRGSVSPAGFIPVVEKTDVILELGLWVFEQACADLRSSKSMFENDLYFSVNLGTRQLLDVNHCNQLIEIATRYLDSPRRLHLEITELAFSSLEMLREAGFRVMVDDFDTGYSSLSYLANYPIDIIKLDRAFVGSLMHSKKSHALLRGVLALAHSLDIPVVAEGIEAGDVAKALAALGCHAGQGYLS